MQMTHCFVLYACLQGKKGDLACGRMNQYQGVFATFKGIGELTFEEAPERIALTGTKNASILIDGGVILWVKTGCKGGIGCLLPFWKKFCAAKAEEYLTAAKRLTDAGKTGGI